MSKRHGTVHLMLPPSTRRLALNVVVASQQTQHNEPTLALHWPIGCDAGPSFGQHCLNVACFVEEICWWLPMQCAQNICITFIQCWTNVENVGPMLNKCYINGVCLLGWTFFVCILPYKVKRQHLLTLNVSRYCTLALHGSVAEAYNIHTNQRLQNWRCNMCNGRHQDIRNFTSLT